MLTVEAAVQRFRAILDGFPSWEKLKKSQFITHVAVFCSYALRAALWAVDRTEQEFFLSTAVSRWSIWAHAEDRNYLPRKPQPSRGQISIQNTGANSVSIPTNTIFYSTAGGGSNQYTALSSATIYPGSTVTGIEVSQSITKELFFTVDVAKPFYTILIPREYSATCTAFKVYVKDMNEVYQEWTYARRFQNAVSDTIYDEFYSHTDQIGIRFGNGNYGEILPEGTEIKVIMWLTNGDTILLVGQQLSPSAQILDSLGYNASLKVLVSVEIRGGAEQEDIEQARQNMLYHDMYDDLIWEQNYTAYIGKHIAGINWCRVFGEQEAERITGPSFANINKVFVSAYKTGVADNTLSQQVIALLNNKNPLNKPFVWVTPSPQYFSVKVTGKVPKGLNTVEVNRTIGTMLNERYSISATKREALIFQNDIYSLIESTGFFSDPRSYFSISITGNLTPLAINKIVCMSDGSFEIGYL